MYTTSQFKPAWWLKNPHGQTILAKKLQLNYSPIQYSETLITPDHDELELAWTENPSAYPNKPMVVMLHGLEGSKDSHYTKGMLQAISQQGWVGLLMHFRGCNGKPNRQLASYHSGDIRDITWLSHLLAQQYPNRKMVLMGFSLGGNVACQYLAKTQNHPYQAASVICAPLDLASCSKKINQGFAKVYQRYLLGMLKSSTAIKYERLGDARISPKQLANIHTMWQFDHQITAPLNGFNSAADYYQQVSSLSILDKISIPTLIVHAKDDPFLQHDIIMQHLPTADNIEFEISSHGGHVGFIAGNNPLKPKFWLEERIPTYFSDYL